jgi:prevent-host-death family protein
MRRVGARELKQHTGAVIERVQRGERSLLTHRGSPIAIITSIDQDAFGERLNREAANAESLAWLKARETTITFWKNAEDAVWDHVEPQPSD